MGPNEKRALQEEADEALKKERANLKKESERLKSNTERSKREIDALREQNARFSRTLAQYQREGLELKREERSGTRSTSESPRKWGERENPSSQVLRRVYREMGSKSAIATQRKRQRENLKERIESRGVGERKKGEI